MFIYIIYMNESKLLNAVFQMYGYVYIRKQVECGLIFPFLLSKGAGGGGA